MPIQTVEDEGVQGVIGGQSIYSDDLDFEAAQDRADQLNSQFPAFPWRAKLLGWQHKV